MFKQAIEQAGEHATRTDIRNAIAGMKLLRRHRAHSRLTSTAPRRNRSYVLEMKNGSPTYKDTIQPAE